MACRDRSQRGAGRAAAFEAATPSAVLDRANRLLLASGRTLFVTAIFGVIDLTNGAFTYATAGHPAPLLEEGGELRRLPAAGLPIGLRDEEGVDLALRMHAPSTLVLYTDGLLEFARDLADGEQRIEAAIRQLTDHPVEHLAGALMAAVLGDVEPTDDIAILTVTIDQFPAPLPGDERAWRFASADARIAAQIRREVGMLIEAWTQRDDVRFPGELAYGELVANAVRHAPRRFRVRVATDGEGNALLEVEDSGSGGPFVPSTRAVEPLAESGRGLALVQGVSDGLTVEPAARGGTRATVRFAAKVPEPARL